MELDFCLVKRYKAFKEKQGELMAKECFNGLPLEKSIYEYIEFGLFSGIVKVLKKNFEVCSLTVDYRVVNLLSGEKGTTKLYMRDSSMGRFNRIYYQTWENVKQGILSKKILDFFYEVLDLSSDIFGLVYDTIHLGEGFCVDTSPYKGIYDKISIHFHGDFFIPIYDEYVFLGNMFMFIKEIQKYTPYIEKKYNEVFGINEGRSVIHA